MDYENLQQHIRGLELPGIETFENIYPDRDYQIRLDIGEYSSICPKTGLPDFGVIRIDYNPGHRCAEMKSLKLYITAFRDLGIFMENAANRILDDFIRAVQPRSAVLTASFNSRGGITTTVTVKHQTPG